MEVLVVPAGAGQPDGAEVVRKTASLPEERERLLWEADVLHEAHRRGFAGVASVVDAPAGDAAAPCLVTRAVAGPSLAVAAPLPVVEVAGVAGEVARLLDGLHAAGLVHGAVQPSHVVLDGAGGAILVGLGDGGRAGAAGLGGELLDPADDVAGWGRLLAHLLDWSAASDDEPLAALRRSLATGRGRRAGRAPGRTRANQDERRVLAALADQAQDPDPARRPAARSLAAAITHRIPAARMPGAVATAPPAAPARGLLDRLSAHVGRGPVAPQPAPASADPIGDVETGSGEEEAPPTRWRPPPGRQAPRRIVRFGMGVRRPVPGGRRAGEPVTAPASALTAPEPAPPGPRRRPAPPAGRRWVVLGVAAAVVVLAAPAAVARLRAPRSPAARAGDRAPAASDRACPVAAPPAADVDGDGCEEAVRWSQGVLEAGTARFALGGPGDAWAVGDWDCDGRRTPALLHGGALAVFDTWPGPGDELHGRPVASVGGATGLSAVPGPDGCDRPSLSRPGAADVLVDTRRAP